MFSGAVKSGVPAEALRLERLEGEAKAMYNASKQASKDDLFLQGLYENDERALREAEERIAAKAQEEAAESWPINEAGKLTEGAGNVGKIPWDSWQNYEKVTANGQEYAKVGNRLYSKHAVDRIQPSGKRFTVGDAIVQAGGVSGRSVAPQFVEDVIRSVEPVFQPATGNYVYTSGTVRIVTNEYGYVVTIMTLGR